MFSLVISYGVVGEQIPKQSIHNNGKSNILCTTLEVM